MTKFKRTYNWNFLKESWQETKHTKNDLKKYDEKHPDIVYHKEQETTTKQTHDCQGGNPIGQYQDLKICQATRWVHQEKAFPSWS